MDVQVIRAFGYFMAANFQAVLLIGGAFKLVSYLEAHFTNVFPWPYLVWPCCVLIIAHSYYLMGVQILRIEGKNKK